MESSSMDTNTEKIDWAPLQNAIIDFRAMKVGTAVAGAISGLGTLAVVGIYYSNLLGPFNLMGMVVPVGMFSCLNLIASGGAYLAEIKMQKDLIRLFGFDDTRIGDGYNSSDYIVYNPNSSDLNSSSENLFFGNGDMGNKAIFDKPPNTKVPTGTASSLILSSNDAFLSGEKKKEKPMSGKWSTF